MSRLDEIIPNIRTTGTLAGGWKLSDDQLAKIEMRAGLAPGTLTVEAKVKSLCLSVAERGWLHTIVHGATPEQLRGEIDRLRQLYNDDDLRRIIHGTEKDLAPRPRHRLRTTDRVRWNTAEGIQTKQELKAMHECWGLTQIKACETWQQQCSADQNRRDWYFAQMDAESLKKQVFRR